MKISSAILASMLAVALSASAPFALAQTARAKWEAHFKAADKNGDGGLSKDELAKSKGFPHIRDNFDAMDSNKDGKVTIAEHDAWQKAQNKSAARK